MQRKNSNRRLTVGVLFAAIAQVLWPAVAAAQNLPNTPGATVGVSGITITGNTMNVGVTQSRAFVNWNAFNVANGYTFSATGPGNFILLNRVTGGTASFIDGAINSSGNIWVINPNGILVGTNARVNVAGMLLSTSDLTDADFLDGTPTYTFAGSSNNAISVNPGAQLTATTGGLFLLANQIGMQGNLQSAGTNALIGSRSMVVNFDANLGAITYLDMGAGSTATNAVTVGPGSSFSGTRNFVTAAGMSTGQGNVLLQNGGATDIRFNAGSVELVSRNADVTISNVIQTPGDLTINAATMIWNNQPIVGGNYSITAQDFSGGFAPVLVGPNSSFTIVDTAGGLTLGTLTAPGDLTVQTLNGGSLTLSTFGSGVSSTNGNIQLVATGGGDLTIQNNVTTGTGVGKQVTLYALNGRLTQAGGIVTTDRLTASSALGLDLTGLNRFNWGSFYNSGAGGVAALSEVAGVQFSSAQSGSGDVTLTGNYGLRMVGSNYRADGGSFTVQGATTLTGATNVFASDRVNFNSVIDGQGAGADLSVRSTNGTTFHGSIGATSILRLLTVNGPTTFGPAANSVRTNAGINLVGPATTQAPSFLLQSNLGQVAVTGDLTTWGNLDVRGALLNLQNVRALAPATLAFTSTGNTNVAGVIGSDVRFNAGGNVNASGAVITDRLGGSVSGTTTLLGDNEIGAIQNFNAGTGFDLRSHGPLSITGNLAGTGDVRLEVFGGDIDIASGGHIGGRDVALSSYNFFNHSALGASAIDASGHWVIYQMNRPTTPNYGGLDSGQVALWGQTFGGTPPSSVTGNRYVFTYMPMLSFTTTNTTKTYGTDLTGATGLFTTSGYMPGVTGAYLGDTATSVFSGAPLLTSTGFGERASVAGGPYAINISTGSLVSLTGYALALNGTGSVTVTPKTLTGTATTNAKTYDGGINGSGAISLAGVVTGDTVGATGTFTFDTRDAGLGKTVTLTGTTLTGADAGNYTLSIPATTVGDILQKALTGIGSVNTKTYDGNASGTGTITLTGVVVGDDVDASGTFTFFDKAAGTNKTVTLSGVTLTGADAGNYTLTVPGSLVGDILRLAITATPVATTKTYDGTNNASGTLTLNGVVGGDDVSANGSFAFDNKNAGTGKTVTVSGVSLTGGDADNYTLTVPASVLGDILQKALTGTTTIDTKTYDGTRNATGTITLNGVVTGDDVDAGASFTFDDKNAGNGKTVTVSGVALNGADAGNYSVTVSTTALGDILRKALTGTTTIDTKTYDGTTTGTGAIALNWVIAGDTVNAAGTYTFVDKNAGAGKTVTVSGVALSGADAGNYTISVPATAIGEILRKSITGVATVNNKTYDGTRNGTGSIALTGVIAGDNVGANGTYTFADANAGNGKSVAVSGVTFSGADAGNYSIVVSGATVADILQRSITVTADPKDKVEGDADPALTYGVTQGSLVAGDSLTGALTRAPGEAPGGYAIGQGSLSASANYRLTFVGSTLTITEAPATPVVNPLAGVALNDDIAGVLQYLERDDTATTLDIADQRACDQSKDSTCDKQ